jgi:hypothetical protein
MNIDSKILVRRHFLQAIVVIYKSIVGDLFGFNYHNLCFVSVHNYSYTREEVFQDFKLLIEVIGTPCHKNNIIDIEKNDDDHTIKIRSDTTYIFQTIF